MCFFTSADGSLTKAHIKYLESRIVEMAKQVPRSLLDNGNTPARPQLPESDIADMEIFIEQVSVLLPVVGFDFMQPVRQVEDSNALDSCEFFLATKSAQATAMVTDSAFVVIKGSTAVKHGSKSLGSYKNLRQHLIDEAVLRPHSNDDELYEFDTDYEFNSPSAAGAIVTARNTNGRAEWKKKSGETFGNWQDALREQSEIASQYG